MTGEREDNIRILELFESGKRFTEELLRENEKLRLSIAQLKTEQRDMEKQLIRVEVPKLQQKVKLLEEEVRTLREENADLKGQFASVEEENREFADQYVKVERQNSDLVNLYVASYRLHSTLDYGEVVQIIKEIVINMIGSEAFGIYVIDEARRELVLIAEEGLDGEVTPTAPLAEGPLGHAARTGEIYTRDGEGASPIACIPLKVGTQVLGVISVHRLLIQKDGFQAVDFELFELLGGHAATALYVAKLYGRSERKRSTLEGFIDLLRSDVPASE